MRTYNPMRILLGIGAFAAMAMTFFSCSNNPSQPNMSLPDAGIDYNSFGDVMPEKRYDADSDLYVPETLGDAKLETDAGETETMLDLPDADAIDDSDADGTLDAMLDKIAEITLADIVEHTDGKITPDASDATKETETYVITSPCYTADDPFLGKIDAPVTIVEFGGYHCPYTKKFHDEILPLIMKDYIDKGLVKYVFRDFPFSFHTFSFESANAAECAKEQGKFWQYHDLLFNNSPITELFTFLWLAEQIGLGLDQFNECVKTDKYKSKTQSDIDQGIALGVLGTPSFFINDEFLDGLLLYSTYKKAIDKELGL